MQEKKPELTFRDVVKDTRTTRDGASTVKIVNFIDEYEVDMITLRMPFDEDVPFQLNIFENSKEEPTHSIALKEANYSASPLRVTDNVSSDKVGGLKPSQESIDNVPQIADSVLKLFSWTVVPDTDEWGDE